MSATSQASRMNQPPAKVAIPPSQTLYLSNLPDKLQKDDLRRALYGLFATYGPVLDVVALKTMKMRGQAHIVFRDIQASTQALRALQGFDFFGKEMQISYAKGKSDVISRLDGSARAPEAKPPTTERTEVQNSIFNNPNMSLPNKPDPTIQPPNGLPAPNGTMEDGGRSPQGVKRPREEESEDGDAPMDEDDEGEAMEESDSE